MKKTFVFATLVAFFFTISSVMAQPELYKDFSKIKDLTKEQKEQVKKMQKEQMKTLQQLHAKSMKTKGKDKTKAEEEVANQIKENKTKLRSVLTTDAQKAEFDEKIQNKEYKFEAGKGKTKDKKDDKKGKKDDKKGKKDKSKEKTKTDSTDKK